MLADYPQLSATTPADLDVDKVYPILTIVAGGRVLGSLTGSLHFVMTMTGYESVTARILPTDLLFSA